MPGVLVKIRSLYSSLPAAERSIADYVQQNPERAPHRSVHEFARASGVSVASVSRFVRKLGFDGLQGVQARAGAGDERRGAEPLRGGHAGGYGRGDRPQGVPRRHEEPRGHAEDPLLRGPFRGGKGHLRVPPARALRHRRLGLRGPRRRAALLLPGHPGGSLRGRFPDHPPGAADRRARTWRSASPTPGRSAITVEGTRLAREKGALAVGISELPALARCGTPAGSSSAPRSRRTG